MVMVALLEMPSAVAFFCGGMLGYALSILIRAVLDGLIMKALDVKHTKQEILESLGE